MRATELRQLRELATGSQALEPPKRNLLASAIARWSLSHGAASAAPHYSPDADDSDKTAFEYGAGMEFWSCFDGEVTLRDLDGKDVLDAGCGWGGKAIYCAEHSDLRTMTGFDLPGARYDPDVPARWACERSIGKCTFLTGFAESMPVGDASADVIIMDDVLEHVTDPVAVVAEWERVLRPSGLVIVRFPSIKMMYAHHFDRVTTIPGLHRIMSMRRWTAGFNHYLAVTGTPIVPFTRIETRFGREVSADLSGMDLTDFERIVMASSLEPLRLELVPIPEATTRVSRAILPIYRAVQKREPFRELLSLTVSFIAGSQRQRPADSGRAPTPQRRATCVGRTPPIGAPALRTHRKSPATRSRCRRRRLECALALEAHAKSKTSS